MSHDWKIREILLRQIDEAFPEKDVAVFLSSGIDSHSILFACLELGKQVTAYTFHVAGLEPKDLRLARNTAKTFNVPFVSVPLNMDPDHLVKRILEIKRVYDLHYKTDIESFFPFMETAPLIKEKQAICGSGADNHFGLTRFAARDGWKDDPDAKRLHNIACIEAGFDVHRVARQALFTKYGIRFIEPYESLEMYRHFLGSGWAELHRPHQKQPIRDAFPEYFAKTKTALHQSLQCGDSEISARFATLLKSKYNTEMWSSVVSIYNRIESIVFGE